MYIYMDIALKFSCRACGKCCRNDWQVTVDEESYQRNAELFLKVGAQAEFQRAFVPLQGRKSLEEYAYIAKRPGGGCWFLTADNLCRLQQQAGHSHLDAVCQTFPRYPMNTARGIELTLSFSCPSVLKMVSRIEPLTIIRSDHALLDFTPSAYTVDVYPSQQPLFSPLRHYFELEQHFIDILQCRGMKIVERLNLMQATVDAVTTLKHDEHFNRNLTSLLYHNYDLLDDALEPVRTDCYTPDILLEHFLVNFVFKKPFYTYGLRRSLLILEHIWRYIESIRKQAIDEITDMEFTEKAIRDVEFQYGHNRRALLQQIKC
jgi:lysine-N-methylase